MFWTTYTPDGVRLAVTRQKNGWKVFCGASASEQHELLDVALIEAIRRQVDFAGHSMRVDYAAWTRELADQIQSDDGDRGSPVKTVEGDIPFLEDRDESTPLFERLDRPPLGNDPRGSTTA